VLMALFPVLPSSTVLDRIGLYLLPLQIVVFVHVPDILGRMVGHKTFWIAAVLLYYAAVLFVWLNFASHSGAWIPYRFYA